MPRALIVEDEPEANRLLSLLVQLRGYQTESAFTGGEAVRMAAQSPPDLVFLDLMLPDTNGYDVCTRLRSARRTGAVPVVMVTARVAAENRLQSFRLGANEYIPKPYTPDQIFDALALAAGWRAQVAGASARGQIPLEAAADLAPMYAQVTRLRCLLLERTGLDEELIRHLAQDLIQMIDNLLAWSRAEGRGRGRLGTLGYDIRPDGMTLRIRDEAGWTSCEGLPHEEGLGLLIGRGRFDQVAYNEAGDEVTLTRNAPP